MPNATVWRVFNHAYVYPANSNHHFWESAMGVRTMTVSGFGTVVESVGSIPATSSAAALTTTSNVCDADNVVINTSGGATINFFLDVIL